MNEQGKETMVPEEETEDKEEHELDHEAEAQEENVASEIESEEEDASASHDKDEEDEEIDATKLQEDLAKLTKENQQLTDRMLRLQAEYENYKRRTEKERIAERKYKAQDLATELLPVMDNFERALQTEVSEDNKGFLEGMEMI